MPRSPSHQPSRLPTSSSPSLVASPSWLDVGIESERASPTFTRRCGHRTNRSNWSLGQGGCPVWPIPVAHMTYRGPMTKPSLFADRDPNPSSTCSWCHHAEFLDVYAG